MIAVELRKQARRVRTYIGLGICVLIPAIITLAIRFGGRGARGNERDFFAVASHSGLTVPFAAFIAMSRFLLPVVVALFFGEAIAGEAGWGTLRYLLARPVARPRLLAAKSTVAGMLSFAAAILVALTGLAAGVIAFGWHPVLTPYFSTMAQGQALWRLGVVTAYVAWDMAGLAAFAFALSTMTDAPVGPIAGAVGFAVVSQILDGINALGSIRYGLPTHYWDAWTALLTPGARSAEMVRGVLLQVPYVIVFGAFAFWWFARKDVLS